MAPDLFGGIAALLYLLYFWLQLRTRDIESFSNRKVLAIVVPAMCAHLIYAAMLLTHGFGIVISVWSSAVLMTLTAMLCTFYLYVLQAYRVLTLFTVPLTVVALVGALLFTPVEGTYYEQPGIVVHILVSMLAYATLALAAVQALSIICLHVLLKRQPLTNFVRWMPPLQQVETTDMHLLWLGGSLLTVSVATGFIFRWDFLQAGNYMWHMSLAVSCWVLYLALICGQLWFGWRGQTSARLSLSAFAILLIGYFGLNFVFGYGT